MRHIHHENSPDFVRNFTEFCKIYDSRISACTRNYELGLAFERRFSQRVVIDSAIALAHPVRNDVEVIAGYIDGTAVRQMSAVRQIHAENGISGL